MEAMRKRGLKILLSYESGRLAKNYISDTYEKLIPIIKQPLNSSKKESDTKEAKVLQHVKGDVK